MITSSFHLCYHSTSEIDWQKLAKETKSWAQTLSEQFHCSAS